jgi:hypothetical protein
MTFSPSIQTRTAPRIYRCAVRLCGCSVREAVRACAGAVRVLCGPVRADLCGYLCGYASRTAFQEQLMNRQECQESANR